MPIRLRTTALRSLLLLGAVCLIIEALVVEQVFYLRDLQRAMLLRQAEALETERKLLPAVVFDRRDTQSQITFIDESDLLAKCCADTAARMKKMLVSANLEGYPLVYTEMQAGIDGLFEIQKAEIERTITFNKWLPLLMALTFAVIILLSWLVLQRRFLGPIARLHALVSQAGLRDSFLYDVKSGDPKEVSDLASSFATLLSRLDTELAGRELALREAKDMVRRETQRISGELAQLFEDSPLPIFGTDRLGKVTTWNRKIAQLTGIPTTEANGGVFTELALSNPDLPVFEANFLRTLEGDSVEVVPLTLRTRGDSGLVLNIHMVPRRSYGGEVVGVNCFGYQLESGLEEAALAMEARQTSQFSQLASSAAHQLNQPLQKMRLYLANAQNRLRVPVLDRDVLVEKLRGVDDQLSKVSDVIDHLREFGRPIEPLKNGFQLATVIERCLDLSRGNLVDRGIRVTYDCQLGDEFANGHPLQVEKPLIALLNNAREAIVEAGPAVAEIKVTVTSISHDQAKITVADNGLGVPTELMRRVFEPFFTTRGDSRNVGLGLSTAQAMVEDLGGKMVLGRENGWTTASIIMPLRRGTSEDAPQ